VKPNLGRVDVHVHLSRYWKDLPRNSYSPSVDFTMDGLFKELEASRITHAVLLQLDTAPNVQSTLTEGEQLARASGGRLLRTSTVDPTRGKAAIEKAIDRWHEVDTLAALKLYPGYQKFYPSDPSLYPLYEFATRRKIPVMVHQGDTLDPKGLVKFARPIELDEVAVSFRELNLVICHLGNPWIEETAELVYKNSNVYADTSGLLFPSTLPYFAALFRQAQRRISELLATVGAPDRVLYGSDWPLESISTAVSLIEGLDIPVEDREKILGGNARRLFRLEIPEGATGPRSRRSASDRSRSQRR
jgi:uncharacterized protein